MTQPATGIVLPASVLTSEWFLLLLTIVAFNTIVYVGLTLSKLLPMPRQIHPGRVRSWMRTLGMDPDKHSAVDQIPRPELPDSPDPFENMRRGIARRDIPQAFGLAGALIILVATVNLFAYGPVDLRIRLVELSVGVLFLVCAQVLGRRHFRAATAMWTWAMACVLLVGVLITQAPSADYRFPVAYAIIVMTAFAPITLSWRPSLAGGALMLIALIWTSQLIEGNDDFRLITAGVAALLVSAVLLRLRLTAIAALSDEQARSEALVTTDLLTQTLTPRGLLTVLPTVAGTAERTGENVCLMSICVEGLATANAQYGVHYGSDVLGAVAAAIRRSVRLGDVVARWEGDEFVVAGIGNRPNVDQFAKRIQEAVRTSGINLGKQPTVVSVGTAAGDPRETTFDQLLLEARAHRSLTPNLREREAKLQFAEEFPS